MKRVINEHLIFSKFLLPVLLILTFVFTGFAQDEGGAAQASNKQEQKRAEPPRSDRARFRI